MKYQEINKKVAKFAFKTKELDQFVESVPPDELKVDLSEPLFPAQPVQEPAKMLSSSNRDFLLSVPALADRLALRNFSFPLISGGSWVVAYRTFLSIYPAVLMMMGLYFLICGNPSGLTWTLFHQAPEHLNYTYVGLPMMVDWKYIIIGFLLLFGRIFALRDLDEEKGVLNKAVRIGLKLALISFIVAIFFGGSSTGTVCYLVCNLMSYVGFLSIAFSAFSAARSSNRNNTGVLCSVVCLSDDGFVFGWLSKTKFLAPIVPWSAVKAVASESLPLNPKYQGGEDATASAMLVIDIDSTKVEHFDLFLGLTNSFVSRWKLDDGWLVPLAPGLVRLHFPLAAISLESERPVFIDALKRNLNSEVLDDTFKALIKDGPRGSSFTRLWLDEANRTRRRNNDELGAGATLLEGRYEIESKLASGGQATVYRGKDTGLGQKVVAIKEFVLPDGGGVGTRSRSVDSISHEAQLLAAFEHSAIPKILDNFIEDGRAYLVFEFIEGRSLRQIVQEDGCFPPDKVIAIGRDLAEILSYMHGLTPPIVHRDLSPDNLMLGDDGRLVLIDFNVAEQLESNATKTVVGKHHYMAPEQFKGKPCPQSDLYSMGGCLYYLATGNEPRPLTVSKLPESASDDAGNISTEKEYKTLDLMIRKLTALSLDERYSSAAQAIDETVAMNQEV